MKIVLNKCYGGYCLSKAAYKSLGIKWDGYGCAFNDKRTDKRLISVVEKLGEKASMGSSLLVVIEIPDGIDYEIEKYDGFEWVVEEGHVWK